MRKDFNVKSFSGKGCKHTYCGKVVSKLTDWQQPLPVSPPRHSLGRVERDSALA